ncbi:MAG: hypothetical protein LBE24_01955 [Methylobacillus sp.]|jgi:phage host-nuclease inhibitor protein Gam|nr:hypothetical protein [Methylobacillus sp.]
MNDNEKSEIVSALGQLSGEVRMMHHGLTARIEDIKADIRRMEAAQSDRMDRIEATLGRRIDNLEAEDKRLIEKTAKLSAINGGVSGAIVAAAVELLKRFTS